jgi:hypothetical protein
MNFLLEVHMKSTLSVSRRFAIFIFVFMMILTCRCSGGSSDNTPINPPVNPPAGTDYLILAWNDLGMHCLNPTYDQAVILPPYNTVWAQVIKRGTPPVVVTSGVTVEYRIVDNTFSYGKRSYGQFWDNVQALFGATLDHDKGLNLEDPTIHNGLTGSMVVKGDHFQVNGIPVTPVNDSDIWNPYQVIEVTAKIGTNTVAQTRTTIPTSDEINCAKCHGDNPFLDVMEEHDDENGTNLLGSQPVLCAGCHSSPALGMTGPGSSGKHLSQAIHGFHASKGAACYDCHPGNLTHCNRSIAHNAPDGNCITCHGTLSQIKTSFENGTKIPWVNEPKCVTCHNTGVAQVDSGDVLYRNSQGHGALSCPACHGSPHAMVPSGQGSDNLQSIQYQSKAKTIGSCAVCHQSSRGGGEGGESGEFLETHGNGGEHSSACNVCHTGYVNPATSKWPHSFQWKSRP